ncbi:Phosphoglucomutase-3 [Xylographa vitiligo]|nr:Phosphoglucomutase-3 [Xylographa vitiligo]
MATLRELWEEWLRLDMRPKTRVEIRKLVEHGEIEELERRLRPRISFGTAGLRARMQAGFARMNHLIVIQTSQGLAEYLLENVSNAKNRGVVIGRDGRRDSLLFAEMAAAVFLAKRFRVWYFEKVVHTPMVPFTIDELGAAAGIMITASHNPAWDNGYKVYGENGCQINSPQDKSIAAHIMDNLEPMEGLDPIHNGRSKHNPALLVDAGVAFIPKYCTRVSDLMFAAPHSLKLPKFVYTAMHGVGLPFLHQSLNRIVVCDTRSKHMIPNDVVHEIIYIVESQAMPDPDFPTVKYPNPEEQGALDLAKDMANTEDISLIFANDPDADRFAVAERVEGEWHQFTGDQVGVLLGYYIFTFNSHLKGMMMLTSAVSSQMLAKIGEVEGFIVEETLTGFKWLGNRSMELGDKVIFAYEEALGYMLPVIVHDKDGVAAAIMFLEACSRWQSPWSKLQELYRKYGYFETRNTYWRCDDHEVVDSVFAKIRQDVSDFPADRKLERFRDLTNGTDSGTEDSKPVLPTDPNTQMITCWLGGNDHDDGIKFTIRASGTEPKVKLYLECQSRSQANARIGASEMLKIINTTWFKDKRLFLEKKYDIN